MLAVGVVIVVLVISVLSWLYKKYWTELYQYWEKKGIPHVPGTYPHGVSEQFSKAAIFPGYLIDKVGYSFLCYGVVLVVLVISVLSWLYKKYWTELYQYWEMKGIPHVPGTYPHGVSEQFSKATVFPGYLIEKYYKEFADVPFFGVYRGFTRLLILRDPEMVKLVLAKEFSHFRDRMSLKVAEDDHLMKHLFMLNGDKWRALRVRMSPVFTSGKLKGMFQLFLKCAQALEDLLETEDKSEVNIKEMTKRFTTEVIVCCAFGLEGGCLRDPNTPFGNLARKNPQMVAGIVHRTLFRLKTYFPFLNIVPPVRITNQEVEDFMMKTVKDTVEHRERTGHKRNDFIDLLIQLKEKGVLNEQVEGEELDGKNVEPIVMTPEVMAAQCFVFFEAGQGTSSSVMSFCLYELARHQDIQERLHQEIVSTVDKHGGVTYQAIAEMEYLDMVISETMRKYPTLYVLQRVCTSPLTLPSGHRIDKGQLVYIPVWSLHYDPRYFPEPEEFNPEHFSRDKRESRHPYAYLPFGEGPRICIGMRFGLLQTKMGILTILQNYKVVPSDKTPKSLTLKDGTWSPVTGVKEQIFLKLEKRA